jgi:3-(3-hydroxy-phenyl)propionate hydroxylase
MLGVRLDADGGNNWSIVVTGREAVQVGDRMPDMPLFDGQGNRKYMHDLCDDSFTALYFTDARRRPQLPATDLPGLRSYVVSRWDAPLDSGLRDRSLLDVGSRVQKRLGCSDKTVVRAA